jgi:hypothetical protein
MYREAKKLMNQKNYIMKHKKITQMETVEINRELQAGQRSHLEEREEEKLEHPVPIKNGEQKPSAVFTTGGEKEIHEHRAQILKLSEKIESTYYQLTQIAIDNRPRLEKPQNMSRIKTIIKTPYEAIGEILDKKL